MLSDLMLLFVERVSRQLYWSWPRLRRWRSSARKYSNSIRQQCRRDELLRYLDEIGVKNLKFYADPKADIFFRLKQGGELMGLPTTYLVDSAGCALGQLSGPAAWDSDEALALIRRATGSTP